MSAADSLLAAAAQMEVEHLEMLARLEQRLAQLEAPVRTYTPADFAEVCHTSERTVRRAIDEDRIKVVVLGDRTLVIPSTELLGDFASAHRRRQIRPLRSTA